MAEHAVSKKDGRTNIARRKSDTVHAWKRAGARSANARNTSMQRDTQNGSAEDDVDPPVAQEMTTEKEEQIKRARKQQAKTEAADAVIKCAFEAAIDSAVAAIIAGGAGIMKAVQ